MKAVSVTVALLVLIGYVFASNQLDVEASVDERGIFDGIINGTINDFLKNLTEPITVDTLALALPDNDYLTGTLNLDKLTLEGIKELVAPVINFDSSALALDMTLDIPKLVVRFNYDVDMVLLNLIPLYGNGLIDIVLTNIQLGIAGGASLTDGIEISNISVSITLDDAHFELTGLIDSPEFSALVSQFLNDNVAEFIDDQQELITKVISPIIQLILDEVLSPDDDGGDDGVQNTIGKQILEYMHLEILE